MNRDPLGERGGTNLYAFVNNQATTKWDFIGLITDVDEEVVQFSMGLAKANSLGMSVASSLTIASSRIGLASSGNPEVIDKVQAMAPQLCVCGATSVAVDTDVGVKTEHIWSLNQISADLTGRISIVISEGSQVHWRFSGTLDPLPDRFDFLPLVNNRGPVGEFVNFLGFVAQSPLIDALAAFEVFFTGPISLDFSGMVICR